MSLETASLEELGLLECLIAIDRNEELNERSWVLRDRLIESGMVAQQDDGRLTLTSAGVERCRSLQHRVAADREAAKVIAARDAAEQTDSSSRSHTDAGSSTARGPTQ